MKGRVIKLDRGYPLVKVETGALVRCEHATSLEKGDGVRAVIGDEVEVDVGAGRDKGVIESIGPRRRAFVRKDPTERTLPQVMAANFDVVIIAEPLCQVNLKRLERELVLAHETGAQVAVALTKADLAASDEAARRALAGVRALCRKDVEVVTVSAQEPETVEAVRALIGPGRMAVLVGKSGVGKSSLVNLLAGRDVARVGSVREGDGKGRHTTVSRAVVDVAGGGSVVDMPGVRGLGLWNAEAGIRAAFSDVEELAARCRFRDCEHEREPGCAVRAAVEAGDLAPERLESYRELKRESAEVLKRREEARHLRGEKASDARRGGGQARRGRRRG